MEAMTGMLDGKLLTVAEAAAELHLSAARVRQLVASKQLKAKAITTRFSVIERQELDAFKKLERPHGTAIAKRPAARKRKAG